MNVIYIGGGFGAFALFLSMIHVSIIMSFALLLVISICVAIAAVVILKRKNKRKQQISERNGGMELNPYDRTSSIIPERFVHGSYSTLNPENDPVYEPLDDYQGSEIAYTSYLSPLPTVVSATNPLAVQAVYDDIDKGHDNAVPTSYDTVPKKPGYDTVPKKPGYDTVPKKPGYDTVPTKPGYDTVPKKPGYNTVPTKPGYDVPKEAPPPVPKKRMPKNPVPTGYDTVPKKPVATGYDTVPKTGHDAPPPVPKKHMPKNPVATGYDTVPKKHATGYINTIDKNSLQTTTEDGYEIMSEKCQPQGNYDYASNIGIATTMHGKVHYYDTIH